MLPALIALALSTVAPAQISAVITVAPPPLPVYSQPVCPGDGYIWTPGYWAWDGDYYWVPGTWTAYAQPGFLWTPGYWTWRDGGFVFIEGYWASTVGFYGGIDYGFGYFGHGYQGGRWNSGHFDYNLAMNRIDPATVHNTYNVPVVETVNHVSYQGGKGGVSAAPLEDELAVASARGIRIPPSTAQVQHEWAAQRDAGQHFKTNRGTPPQLATLLPNTAVHPKDLPPQAKLPAPNTGNAQQDQKLQKQQESILARQSQEREKLQQKQEKEDSQVKDPAKAQSLEQQHRLQTQQLAGSHARQLEQFRK